MNWSAATEQELCEAKVPWPESIEELTSLIEDLRDREHDYGTCVYAMSIAATAAMQYIAKKLGCTGFQASFADLDILTRSRGMKHGFMILDYSNLLYPQYRNYFDDVSFGKMLAKNHEWLRVEAKKLLAEQPDANPAVIAHWQMLVNLPQI